MSEERKNKVVFVKVPGNWRYTEQILRDWADRFLGLGMLRRVDRNRLAFETDLVRCRLIPSQYIDNYPMRLQGLRCDECFEFGTRETEYLRFDHNPENAYKGSVLEYICEVEGVSLEGVKYDRPGLDVTEITGAATGDT